MFSSKKRKARSEAYHESIKNKLDNAKPEKTDRGKKSNAEQQRVTDLLKGSKPNGGFGYDVEELARQESAAQAYEVRRHTDKRGRTIS